ncbi:MAG TPA: AzlC family ABC transporter permease [Ktedonobacteraceae bacterium]
MVEPISSMPTQQPDEIDVTFDLKGVIKGAKLILPIALGVATYGLVFGVLAQQAKLTVLEVLLMSSLVYAGSAQLVVLSLWISPLPIGIIILTTLIVNARNLLMGVAISPWFRQLSPLKAYTTLFFLTDENWALTMSKFSQGESNAALLLGSGLVLCAAWVSSTVVGRLLGNIVHDPERWGLDFAFTAVFLALLVPLWKGKSNLLPWIVAAIVAVAAAYWLPGKWYILLGGLAGSVVGGLRHAD